MNPVDVEITAGLGGFLVLFGLALVVWFLGRDLSRRLRRMRQVESQRLQADADADADSGADALERADGEALERGEAPAGVAEASTDAAADPASALPPAEPPVSPPRP